jgi:LPPG:FO 2-phospho-L-lactate transferase
VVGVRYEGAELARPNPFALAAIADPATQAIIICPSNPVLSIDPILAVPGMRAALAKAKAPVIAVSPLIGGQAVKGPTAEIMNEMGLGATAASVAAHYEDILDGFVLDDADAPEHGKLAMPTTVTRTLMTTLDDRTALARTVLDFAASL